MRRVAIVGMGLMGGSLGLALRQRGRAVVRASARRAETRALALERGAADAVFERPEDAVRGTEIAVFCTPVLSIPALIRECLADLAPGMILTDVGSTKAVLGREAAAALAGTGVPFIGSHPMTGSEQTGLQAARADLYEGAVVAVTPEPDASAVLVGRLAEFWTGVGANVVQLDAGEHDRLVARTSHLPHLVAAALVAAAGRENLAHLAELCGPGFRDTTRIASGSPDLWLDIVKSNQDVLANELRAFNRELARLTALVEKGDFEAVRRLLEAARERREGLLATSPPRRGRS